MSSVWLYLNTYLQHGNGKMSVIVPRCPNLKDFGNLFCEISQPALKSLVHRKSLKKNITMYNRVFHKLHKIGNTPVLVSLSDNETIQQ